MHVHYRRFHCISFTIALVYLYRRQIDVVSPDDIILTDITDDEQRQLTFIMHIQVDNGRAVLSASTLLESVKVHVDV